MPIEITTFPTKPAVNLNRIHMVELRINITEEQQPKAQVRLVYKLYGHDADGVRHFDTKQYVIPISDAYVQAAIEAQAGNFELLNTLQSLEGSVAALVTSTGKHGDATRV